VCTTAVGMMCTAPRCPVYRRFATSHSDDTGCWISSDTPMSELEDAEALALRDEVSAMRAVDQSAQGA
jgi:hypothetical protein